MPRETLTKDQIITAAIELLDADGADGLSMRKLGQHLGSAATAVYWHVPNKDDLLALAGEHVWSEIPRSRAVDTDWRAAATELATAMYAMLTEHPWVLPAVGTHFLYGPNMAAWQEYGYGIIERAGFTGTDQDWALSALFTFVFGSVLGEATDATWRSQARRRGEDPDRALADELARAKDVARQFPRLQARLAAGADLDNPDARRTAFDYGLQALLDGLQARL
ncbi:TetR family transcriptional regulator [Pseudonocardiaceae bacterium YIM PH 21723]|nr:TetR family transcriptional regulator [Pseudonocardiaceae bacterium YIM PH 21723]